jgi:hypothetical protein
VNVGNWRTVNIVGTIAPPDLAAARGFVNTGEDYSRFHPLCNHGFSICGLGDWVREDVLACGNLSERDYSIEDVAGTLRQMASVVPSLRLKVHCGGDYESTVCVATVTVAEGVVTVGAPEVAQLGGMDALAKGRLAELLDDTDR